MNKKIEISLEYAENILRVLEKYVEVGTEQLKQLIENAKGDFDGMEKNK